MSLAGRRWLAAVADAAASSAALLAPWLAPHNPFDLATLSLLRRLKPPAWAEDGDPRFPLGTDDQGRDVLSAIMYGARMSLLVGFALGACFSASSA